jgi:glycosyltransferase involved in cell wall biosynthesis
LPVGLVGQSSIAALRRVSVKLAELAVVPGRPVTRATLREVDVFHSTFYPLPSDLRSRDLVRFLTVYDLIPLLYPELFAGNPSARHVLARAIASISGGDWVICISESTKRDLCQYAGIRAEQVFVAPLAASPDLFHPVQDHDAAAARRQRYGLPSEPYVLTVNTIEPRKNLALAIRAFARLIEQEGIRDLRLVLVGPKGWDYNGVLGAIQEFPRVRDRVILSGYIPDKDLATVYSGAMMFLYPSLYEGFGLPPLEAMQCGLPVITSNTSSLPEVVGDAGITVAPTDEDAVSESILRLYWDRGLREALAAKSLERSRQFSWDRCTQDTVAAYKWAVDCR